VRRSWGAVCSPIPANGRAGNGFGEGTGAAFRDWWNRFSRDYDVRANVGVPGEVYGKYSTNFGTQ